MHTTIHPRSVRTILLALLLTLLLLGCASKDDTPEEPAAEATESAQATETTESADSAAGQPTGDTALDEEILLSDPVGEMHLQNGTVWEITKLMPIGKFSIYIVGQLNGRSSTVISLTRLSDLRRWKSIEFKDPHTFTITSRDDERYAFTDGYLFLGTDSNRTYTFLSADPITFDNEEVEVNKEDVLAITIKAPSEEP